MRTPDTGGEAARVELGKASSTPPSFELGFLDAIGDSARRRGLGVEELLRATDAIFHGCTVGTNALVEGTTASVGLITTRGHGDSIFIMQGGGRLVWESPEYVARVAAQTKPAPLVPKELCVEVDERIAVDGSIVVPLNEDEVERAVDELVASGVEAIACSTLWSTANPVHEQRIAQIVRAAAPDCFISLSCEVAARAGEYPRTVATVINSLVGPVMMSYLERLGALLRDRGYGGTLELMTCSGGLVSVQHAQSLPVLTIGSGPVAGLIGSANVATEEHVLTADMGGTTFDVGLILGGEPVLRSTASYGQYEYYVPTLDVRSVGAGGGSIISTDHAAMRVGPRSAGARPGPVCYRAGGTAPTVTDANLALGYLNPAYFLAGQLSLDRDASMDALAAVGEPLELSALEAASAAVKIADSHMADAIRLATIRQGRDVRDFTLYAYGGAGPVHATALARDLGMRRVVVPMSDFAAGWSAFGVAFSDAAVVQEADVNMTAPFDIEMLNARWTELEGAVRAPFDAQGRGAAIEIGRSVDMRYALQVNQVTVPAPVGPFDRLGADALVASFEAEYERLFGQDSGYAAVGIVLSTIRARAVIRRPDKLFGRAPAETAERPVAPKAEREVVWYDAPAVMEVVPIYDGPSVSTGHRIAGPGIVEFPDTTIVLRRGDTASTTDRGVVIDVGEANGGGTR